MSTVAAKSTTLSSPYTSDPTSTGLVYHHPSSTSRRRTKSGNTGGACVEARTCCVARSRSLTTLTPSTSSTLYEEEEERLNKAASSNDKERRRNSPSTVRRRKCATAAATGNSRSVPPLYLGARLEYYAMNEDSADIWLTLPTAASSSSSPFANLRNVRSEERPTLHSGVDCSNNTLTCSASVAVIPLKSCLAKPKALLICGAQESVYHEALDLSSMSPNINTLNGEVVNGESYDDAQMDNTCDEGYCSPTSSCTLEVESIIVSRKAKTFTINISLPVNSSDDKDKDGRFEKKVILDQYETSTGGINTLDNRERLISTPAENYPSILSKKEQQTRECGPSISNITTDSTVAFVKNKKKVKFADDLGMNLINVRILSDPLEEVFALKTDLNASQDKYSINSLTSNPTQPIVPMFSNLEISQTQKPLDPTFPYYQSRQGQQPSSLPNLPKPPTPQSSIKTFTQISPKIEPIYEWAPEFGPPISDYQTFSNRLDNLNIALESVRIKAAAPASKLIASVRVRNVTSGPVEKYVFARVTTDNWTSHFDVPCEYVPAAITSFGPSARVDDQYMCEIEMPQLPPPGTLDAGGQARKRVEFAMCLKISGSCEYEKWDNNDGKNYCLSVRATLPLTQPQGPTNLDGASAAMPKSSLSRRGQAQPDSREGPSRSTSQVQFNDNQAPYW